MNTVSSITPSDVTGYPMMKVSPMGRIVLFTEPKTGVYMGEVESLSSTCSIYHVG
jgi:hypothetical protein